MNKTTLPKRAFVFKGKSPAVPAPAEIKPQPKKKMQAKWPKQK